MAYVQARRKEERSRLQVENEPCWRENNADSFFSLFLWKAFHSVSKNVFDEKDMMMTVCKKCVT